MKLIIDANNTKVYDDVLDQETFNNLFTYFNYIPLVFQQAQEEWNRVWSFSDGNILVGQPHTWFPNKPPPLQESDKILLTVIKKINECITSSNFFDIGQIQTLVMTPFCWPPGTGLSWHNDSNYLGAVTFYCHNYWSPEWGGEFLTVEANDYIYDNKKNITWKVFDNQELYDIIMERGHGHFFHPKPNRLILNKGGEKGILHKVNKSTLDSRARLTLQCFIRGKNGK